MFYTDQGMSGIAKALTPTLIGLAGVLALSLPIRLFEGTIPTPLIPLIVIFFWSLYGPDYVPSVSTFLIGLLQDFMLGGPLGVWTTAYLVTQYMIINQRSYFQGREQHVVWLGFLIAALTAGLMVWGAMSMFSGQWLSIWPMLGQVLVTFAFYPVLAVGFSSLHERVIMD